MALKLPKHQTVRTSVGLPLMGGDVYCARIDNVPIRGWFVPLEGGLTVRYSNNITRHKKDGWVVMVDYDEPMYTATLQCMYTLGWKAGPLNNAPSAGGSSAVIKDPFLTPGIQTYDPHGTTWHGNPTTVAPGGPATVVSGGGSAGTCGVTGAIAWAFGVGDVWRFQADEAQSDRGSARPSRTDFVGTNLLLEPGTQWNQPANGFWQLTLNFANLLGSPAMAVNSRRNR